MTIGVQGEWGSGKTSLLNSIYHSLDKEGESIYRFGLIHGNTLFLHHLKKLY